MTAVAAGNIRGMSAMLLVALLAPGAVEAQVPGQFVSDNKTGCKFWWPESLDGATIQSFRWSGGCAKGFATGHGTFEAMVRRLIRAAHLDGSETTTAHDRTWTGEGEAAGGKLNGRAFMTTNFGYRIEGEYRDGVLNGRDIFTTNTKSVQGRYEGEFRNGKRESTGVSDEQQFLFTDGPPVIAHYVGEWKDGKQIKGLLTQRMPGCSAEERYEGEMTDGKYNGRGTLTAADGKVYSGTWNMGRINLGGRELSASDIQPLTSFCRK